MAHDKSLDAFRDSNGGFDHSGAINAGTQQAETRQPCSDQQPGESASAFEKRVGAYNAAKKD